MNTTNNINMIKTNQLNSEIFNIETQSENDEDFYSSPYILNKTRDAQEYIQNILTKTREAQERVDRLTIMMYQRFIIETEDCWDD